MAENSINYQLHFPQLPSLWGWRRIVIPEQEPLWRLKKMERPPHNQGGRHGQERKAGQACPACPAQKAGQWQDPSSSGQAARGHAPASAVSPQPHRRRLSRTSAPPKAQGQAWLVNLNLTEDVMNSRHHGAPHQTVQGGAVRYAQGFPSVLMSQSIRE